METKEKTIKIGDVIKGQYGNFISLDASVKDITITREYTNKEGKTITEVLSVASTTKSNGKTYLSAFNVEKIDKDIASRVEKGWLTDDQAEREREIANKNNKLSYVKVKVKSKG